MYGLYGAAVSGLAEVYLHFSAPWWACAVVTMLPVQLLGSLNLDLGARFLAVSVIALFFAFVSWMVISSYGSRNIVEQAGRALESEDSTALVFSAVTQALGGWAGTAAGVLMATSLLAGILAFHNASNRYVHSLGRTGAMPPVVSRTNRQGAPFVASGLQTALALVLILPFAVLGLDPVLTLFSWGSGVAILGLLILYFLTSVSVVVFFRRTQLDTRPWHTLVAPLLAAVLITGLATLVLANFDLLTGGAPSTAIPLILTVPTVLLIGAAIGRNRDNDHPTASISADPAAETDQPLPNA